MRELLKNFWMTLKRFRTSSLLNVVGMAVAFAALYMIAVQIHFDLFYNSDISDSGRVYRVEYSSSSHEGMFTTNSNRFVPENCIKDLPSVEACGCGNFFVPFCECTVERNGELKHYRFRECKSSIDFLKVFNFSCIDGDLADIVKPRSLAISETVAKEAGVTVGDDFYLGTQADKECRYQVVAIFKNFSPNTDLRCMQIISNLGEENMDVYNFWGYNYYVKLASSDDVASVAQKSEQIWKQRELDKGVPHSVVDKYKLRLTPITETFYKADVHGGGGDVGNKGTTCTLLVVAALIVIIAFVNFINFFFALVPIRIRAINTHKIFGCSLLKLRGMLVFESIGLVLIALAIAAFIVLYIQNTDFAKLISSPLFFDQNVIIVVLVVCIAVLFALLTSLYPAYYITSFPTAIVLKSSFGTSKSGRQFRYMLIGIQFIISIALIICAIFVRLQYSYMMHYDMGFNKELLLTANVPNKISEQISNRDAFDSRLLANSNIKEVAWGTGPLISNNSRMSLGYSTDTSDVYVHFEYYPVSWNFLRFMDIAVVEGRDFMVSDELKQEGTYILNQSAQKLYNLNPGDKMIVNTGGNTEIVGFCNDFNFRSLQTEIEPFAFYIYGSNFEQMHPHYLYVRTTQNADVRNVIDCVKDAVLEMDPSMYRDAIDVKFFNEELQINYQKEEKLASLITLFSILAIIISLMGVFGLVMFETQYRMKEIAIRRVHGASVSQILKMFNAKFMKIIVVCFVVAVPISYCFIDSWLSSFAYKMPVYWWVFAVALVIVLIITIVTVTARSYSAATSDPAKLVKTE